MRILRNRFILICVLVMTSLCVVGSATQAASTSRGGVQPSATVAFLNIFDFFEWLTSSRRPPPPPPPDPGDGEDSPPCNENHGCGP